MPTTETKTIQQLQLEIERLEAELESRKAVETRAETLPSFIEIETFIKENPISALLIASALGVGLGYLLNSLKNNEELMGQVSSYFKGYVEQATANVDIPSLIAHLVKKS